MDTDTPQLWGKRGLIFFNPATGDFVGLTPETVARWKAAFPLVDVKQELAKAAVWCSAGAEKRRKQNYGMFLVNWLNRANDRRELNGRVPMPRLGDEFERAVGL